MSNEEAYKALAGETPSVSTSFQPSLGGKGGGRPIMAVHILVPDSIELWLLVNGERLLLDPADVLK